MEWIKECIHHIIIDFNTPQFIAAIIGAHFGSKLAENKKEKLR